jgi:hypothetical protein
MTSAKTRKSPTRKKKTVRRKKKAPRFFERIPVTRILLLLALALFLFVSVAAAGYVIFFRVVVADQTGLRLEGGWPVAVTDGSSQQQETAANSKLSALNRWTAPDGQRRNRGA